MIEWERVPWPLWAYVAVTTGVPLVVVLTVSAPLAPLIFLVVFTLAWNFLLLRAHRWLWIATVVLFALITAFNLVASNGTWYGNMTGLIEVGLLLLPATRRFFGIGESSTVA